MEYESSGGEWYRGLPSVVIVATCLGRQCSSKYRGYDRKLWIIEVSVGSLQIAEVFTTKIWFVEITGSH